MAAQLNDIIAYYVNLLIIQYWDKPNAKAMVALFVEILIAEGVLEDVRDGYDIDTAIGHQLDIIGKYVGVDRFFQGQILDGYFAMVKYSEDFGSINPGKRGFSSYADMSKSGLWVQYKDIISTTYTLNDDDYRTVIRLKIFQNNNNNSHKSIDDFIFATFGGDVTVSQGAVMRIDYASSSALNTLVTIAIEKDVLPRPAGVQLTF